ncbi:ammonium transporter [Methanolobus vulcani]|jgi:Amt family ammonium transporter|uniref:Ammonium transporter n=1 Tax=Methanolobus vulcani TaxID=38026 RepID=A0A7Z7AW12_9EURY|nr:ammonium transporter [Methanolobus vulcani]MDK2825772.1 ammonium transporter, Amt family [Methanolobus sp.]SDF71268.1 ammonium transporter [Methanolobus vulcani]
MYGISQKLNSKMIWQVLLLMSVIFMVFIGPASAATVDENSMAIGDLQTALTFMWLLICGAIVFLMHAGFSLVEIGLTRTKNTANILMKNFMTICLGIVVYWLVGWGIMYGADAAGLIGTNQFMLMGAMDNATWNGWWFQMVFAATGATIVSGAMAERTDFKSYLIYTVLMVALIYPVYGHWVWSGAGILTSGFLVDAIGQSFHDFAGSGVVHSIGGYSALAGIMLVGPRIGKFKNGKAIAIPGHSLPLAFLGTLILAFGWVGFNGGSTLDGNDPYASMVIVNTFLAAGAGAIMVMIITWIKTGKPDPSLTANGLLAGLVAITAPCGSVTNWASVVIGLVAGIVVYAGVMFNENTLKLDDPVGAVAVHGYCGTWGLLAVGIFALGQGDGSMLADAAYTAAGAGLIYGGTQQFMIQVVGAILSIVWAFVISFIIFKILDAVVGLRVSEEHEIAGLDVVEHGISAYPEFMILKE